MIVLCPTCKRRLTPSEREQATVMQCPGCQTSFLLDADGNAVLTAMSSDAPSREPAGESLFIQEGEPVKTRAEKAQSIKTPLVAEIPADMRKIERKWIVQRGFCIWFLAVFGLFAINVGSDLIIGDQVDVLRMIEKGVAGIFIASVMAACLGFLMLVLGDLPFVRRWYLPYLIIGLGWVGFWVASDRSQSVAKPGTNPYAAESLRGLIALTSITVLIGVPVGFWVKLKSLFGVDRADLQHDTRSFIPEDHRCGPDETDASKQDLACSNISPPPSTRCLSERTEEPT